MTGVSLRTPEDITLGARVLILLPTYVAGKVGTICGREVLSDSQPSNRWLVQLDVEDIVVSLTPKEFRILS